MGKRSKKKKKPHRSAQPKQGVAVAGFASVTDELAAALLQLRGRRSVVLARQLKSEENLSPKRRGKLVAAAHEAYARELLDGGHTGSAVDHMRSFAAKEPEVCKHVSLSLQVRMGLIPDFAALFEDGAWRERLRRELVAPDDLLDCPVDSVAADARAVCDALQDTDRGLVQSARERIAGIGRRSVLVDWRLFAQANLASWEGRTAERDAALARIMAGTPAAHLGTMLRACAEKDMETLAGTELSAQTSISEADCRAAAESLAKEVKKCRTGRASKALCNRFQELLKLLLLARRQSAANLVFASVCRECRDDMLFDAAIEAGIPLLYTRVLSDVSGIVLDDILVRALGHKGWGAQERALLLLERAKLLKRMREAEHTDLLPWEDYEAGGVDLTTIQSLCREAAGCWPAVREAYAIWRWAEQYEHTYHAVSAEVRAFPADPPAWERKIRRLADLRHFKECEKALALLAELPGTSELCSRLLEDVAFTKMFEAFENHVPFMKLKVLGEVPLQSGIPFVRCQAASMLWLRSKGNKQKRQSGVVLSDLDHPWLTALFCYILSRESVKISRLPASIRRALHTDPVNVVRDFLLFADAPVRSQIGFATPALLRCLVKAAAHPAVSLQMACDCARHLLLEDWHDERTTIVYDYQEDMLAITGRLLDSGSHPSSVAVCAMAMRAFMYHEISIAASEEVATPLLRAASVLSMDAQSKGIVRRVWDLMRGDRHAGDGAIKQEDALARWQQECRITDESRFFDVIMQAEENFQSAAIEGVLCQQGAVGSFEDAIERLIDVLDLDSDEDDWDDEDAVDADDEDVVAPSERASVPTPSGFVPLDLRKCHPVCTMEFEKLIAIVKGQRDVENALLLEQMIKSSALSEREKNRLITELLTF